MFKGLFDFRTQKIHLRWSIIAPALIFIILGLISLSSTSDLSTWSSPFYKQCLWLIIGIITFCIRDTNILRVFSIYKVTYRLKTPPGIDTKH